MGGNEVRVLHIHTIGGEKHHFRNAESRGQGLGVGDQQLLEKLRVSC